MSLRVDAPDNVCVTADLIEEIPSPSDLAPGGAGGGRYQEALVQVAAAISLEGSLEQMLTALAAGLRSVFGVRRCSIFLGEEAEGVFRCRAADGDDARAGSDAAARIVCGIPADRFTGELVRTGRPVHIANARMDPRPVRKTVLDWDLRAVLGIPMVAEEEVVGLVFLDDPGSRHGFDHGDEELAAALVDLLGAVVRQARSAEVLRGTAAQVARQNRVLMRTNSLQARLTELALDARNVGDLAEAVTSVTGSTCIVYGPELQRLACASAPGAEGDPSSILDAVGSNGAREVLDQVAEKGAAIVGPFPQRGETKRSLVAAVSAQGRIWGYLVLVESGRRLNGIDTSVARQAASIVALEFGPGGGEFAIDPAGRDRLLREALDGSAAPEGLRERVERQGLRIDGQHVVVLVRAAEGGTCMPSPAEIEAALRAGGSVPAAIIELDDGTMAAILRLDPEAPPLEATRRVKGMVGRAISTFENPGGVLAAVSSACSSAGEWSCARDEAERILEQAAALGERVLCADELGVGRFVLSSADGPEAQRFARGVLGPLLDNRDGAGDLLATLNTFFICGRSVRYAAVRLGVHQNTIRYRLARITDLLALDLMSDPDDQLSCQLALMILRLDGSLMSIAPSNAA